MNCSIQVPSGTEESAASTAYRAHLFQAVQACETGNGQAAETDSEGNGDQEEAAKREKGGTEETACPLFRFRSRVNSVHMT